jgi:Na+/melibiose symporter-like transporter
MSESETKEKFPVKLAFFISLAVFAQEITWNFYDSQVPVSLLKYISSVAIVGLIMGLDNLLGLFIEPIIGKRSDNTRTRFGRRIPYIMVGIPVAAIFFILIPFETSLLTLLIFILGYVTVMLLFKAPTESLLPDFISEEHRSKANSIGKIMTSISIIVAALISLLVVDVNLQLAFIISAIIMVLCLFIVLSTVKEKNSISYQLILKEEELSSTKDTQQKKNITFRDTFRLIRKEKDKSTFIILLSVLLMSLAWSGLRALLTPYAMEVYGLSRGTAGSLTLYGGIAFLIFAYPLSALAEKYGRFLFIKLGFTLIICSMVLGFLIQTLLMLIIAVILLSIGWSTLVINMIVIIWGKAPSSKEAGTYTGLYYFFYYGAAAFGPALLGLFTDLTSWYYLLLNAAIIYAIGFILILFVKSEAPLEENVELKYIK